MLLYSFNRVSPTSIWGFLCYGTLTWRVFSKEFSPVLVFAATNLHKWAFFPLSRISAKNYDFLFLEFHCSKNFFKTQIVSIMLHSICSFHARQSVKRLFICAYIYRKTLWIYSTNLPTERTRRVLYPNESIKNYSVVIIKWCYHKWTVDPFDCTY